MSKYHISPTTGNPNKCSAQPGACPFGTEDDHYPDRATAQAAFEAKSGGSFSERPSGESRIESLAKDYFKHSSWAFYPEKPSGAQLRNAAAYAQLNNVFAAVGYSSSTPADKLDLELDYDNSGSDWVAVETRSYTVATPTGEFVRVDFKAGVHAEYDDYWEFNPDLQAQYKTYPNARALAGDKPATEDQHFYDHDDETLIQKDSYGTIRSAYDYSDETSTRSAAKRLMETHADPYAMARRARLEHSTKRIKGEALMGKNYLESPRAYVRIALAQRKELPREAQATLAQDSNASVRYALAQRSDLSSATVKTLLSQNDFKDRGAYSTVRHALLANEALTATVQEREAKKGTLDDLKALARNPKLSAPARATIEARTKDLGVQLAWGQRFTRWQG